MPRGCNLCGGRVGGSGRGSRVSIRLCNCRNVERGFFFFLRSFVQYLWHKMRLFSIDLNQSKHILPLMFIQELSNNERFSLAL